MYEKQNFKNGDILDAAQLEAMEDGIIEAQSSSGGGGTQLYEHALLLNYDGEIEGEMPEPLYIISTYPNEIQNIDYFSGLDAISFYGGSWYLPNIGPILPLRKLYETIFYYNLDSGQFSTVGVQGIISDTVTPL